VFPSDIFRKREKTNRTSFRLRALGTRNSGFRDGVQEKPSAQIDEGAAQGKSLHGHRSDCESDVTVPARTAARLCVPRSDVLCAKLGAAGTSLSACKASRVF